MGWNEWGENLLVGGVKEQELVAVTGREDLEPVKPYPFQPGEQADTSVCPSSWSTSRLKHRKLSYLNGVVGVRWFKKNFFFSYWQDNWASYFFSPFGAGFHSKSLSARTWRMSSALMRQKILGLPEITDFSEIENFSFPERCSVNWPSRFLSLCLSVIDTLKQSNPIKCTKMAALISHTGRVHSEVVPSEFIYSWNNLFLPPNLKSPMSLF